MKTWMAIFVFALLVLGFSEPAEAFSCGGWGGGGSPDGGGAFDGGGFGGEGGGGDPDDPDDPDDMMDPPRLMFHPDDGTVTCPNCGIRHYGKFRPNFQSSGGR